MAAVGPQILDLKVFEMHFNQMIRLEKLIRSGNKKEAVHADLRVSPDPVMEYEAAMKDPDGHETTQSDFSLGRFSE